MRKEEKSVDIDVKKPTANEEDVSLTRERMQERQEKSRSRRWYRWR